MGNNLTQVLDLAGLGFKVFPVTVVYDHDEGKWKKKPAILDGFKGGTSDPYRVTAMFSSIIGSDMYVGMVHEHMTIVDADGEKGVDSLNLSLPVLPQASLIVRTVSGGIHYYIPGCTDLGGNGGRKIRFAPGLDVLTGNDKGFVVVPPSPGYTIISGSFEELAEDIRAIQSDTTDDSSSGGEIPF